MKSLYERWHEKKYHSHVHFGIFAIYAALLVGAMVGFMTNPGGILAATDSNTYYIPQDSPQNAGEPSGKDVLSTNKDTAVANGTDTITISATSLTYYNLDYSALTSQTRPSCDDQSHPAFLVRASGSGNTITPESMDVSCPSGTATFTLKSTVAGTKQITVYGPAKDPVFPWLLIDGLTVSVNFTTPPVAATTKKATTTTTTTATTASTTPATATTVTSETPVVVSKFNGTAVSADSAENVFEQSGTYKLTGTTYPNAKVTLYIYSEPFITQVTADANGYWEYVVTKTLEPGAHKIEAEVTKADGTVVPKAEIANFRIAAVSTTAKPVAKKTTNTMTYVYYALGAFVILAGAVITVVVLKKRKKEAVA